MASLLIVWHSRTGGSLQMAEIAYQAASQEIDARLLRVEDARPQDFLDADGYLFVGPENLAALSGAMKELLDRCYYPLLGQIGGRPYAHMVCAGSDGTNAARQLARICTGWRLRAIADPLIINTKADSTERILAEKTLSEDQATACTDLGRTLGAGLAMGII